MTTIYTSLEEINELQKKIMVFIDQWVRTEKTPVPHRMIIVEMHNQKVPDITTAGAITALLRKGYIRRACTISNKTYYVQLRSVR
jgi:hypothetical protein